MGNTRSEFFEPVSVDLWWNNDQANTELVQINQQRTIPNEEKMAEEVPQEISTLHEKRIRIIAEKKKEMDGLREELVLCKKQNEELKGFIREKGFEPPIQECDITKIDVSLQTETFAVPGGLEDDPGLKELQKELQRANSDLEAFETERKEYKTHVTALKDIITVSKQLLMMRENQIKELTQKVAEIQESLAAKELEVFSEDLRQEYQRQLQNIKQLRALYEERQRADKTERINLKSQLDEAQSLLKTQETKNVELQERVDELEKDNSNKYDTLVSVESQLGLTKAECAELRSEMSVINQLFSQILSGLNNGQEIDMDKLIKSLEENHDLLTEIVINEESNELSSALPKVLLDLVSQVNEKSNPQQETNSDQGLALETIAEESESQNSTQQNSLSSASEIVQNLPKVWKILMELLSHQTAPISVLNEGDDQGEGDSNPCYKSVQTPTGPTMVLSVSKTYIRLKNLIVEKKSLEKETTRLKQLNTHLETRLQDQEKRLEMVSSELSKTWHVVGKMQKQHQLLHTQEKILRYELAQKRKLLNELKEELEYCREKWMQAREKNSTTEEQWKQLRNEFAARKNTVSEDLNNSVESGYSDERESSSSDDDIEEENAGEGNNPTILNVVKEEIAKIESAEPSETETSSSSNCLLQSEGEAGEHLVPSPAPEDSSLALSDVIDEILAPLSIETEETSSAMVDEMCTPSSLGEESIREDTSLVAEDGLSAASSMLVEHCTPSPEGEDNVRVDKICDGVTEEPPSTMVVEICTASPEEEVLSMVDEICEPFVLDENSVREGTSSASSMIVEICTPSPEEEDNVRDVSDMADEICAPFALAEDGVRKSSSAAPATEEEDNVLNSTSSVRVNEICEPYALGEYEIREGLSLALASEQENNVTDSTSSVMVDEICEPLALIENAIMDDEDASSSREAPLLEALLPVDNVPSNQEEEECFSELLKTDLVQNQEVQSNIPKTREEVLAAREARLQRLEEQAKDLITQRTNTSNRSVEICTKLDNLHEQYGADSKARRKDIDDIYKKLEEDILQTIKKTQNGDEYPSTSRQTKSTEEILAAREERLKQLEEKTNVLVNQTKLDKTKLEACTSSSRTPEEFLARREERLQQMEEQAQQLVSKARRNSLRNVQFWRKLNNLHDRYGESADSSDDSADDNNNTNADGVEQQDVNNQTQLDLDEATSAPKEGEEEE